MTGSSPLATQISLYISRKRFVAYAKFKMSPGDFTTPTHVRNGSAAPVRRLGFVDSAEKVSKKKLRTPSRRDQLQEHGALLASCLALVGFLRAQDSMSPGQAFASPGPEGERKRRTRSLFLARETRQTGDETGAGRSTDLVLRTLSVSASLPLLRLIPVGRYFAEMSQARTPSGARMRGEKGAKSPERKLGFFTIENLRQY